MKIRPRRARRIQDEMRLWLGSSLGVRAAYSREEIDQGREELGFNSVEDMLVAYTLFGGDLMPGVAESLGISVEAGEIGTILEAASGAAAEATALLIDD